MDRMIAALQGTKNKFGKAVQTKEADIQPAPAAAGALGEAPAQGKPDINQEQTERHEKKAIGRIRRSGPTTDLSGTAVAGFHTETTAVEAAHLSGCHLQIDKDKEVPFSTTAQATGPLGGGEATTDRKVCRAGLSIGSLRSEEHTSELQSRENLVCRLLLEKKKKNK